MNAYRKGLTISLGVISAQVDLHNIVPGNKDRSTKMLCPTHFQQLKQEYHCPGTDKEEGHTVPRDQATKGVATATGWQVPEGEKERAKTDPIELTPVPTAVLIDKTFEGTSSYYLTPSSAAYTQAWEVIVNVLRKGKISLVAKTALGQTGKDKLWRLEIFRSHLVMRELIYPEAITEPPTILHVKVEKAITTLVDQFVDQLTADFESLDLTDPNIKRFDEWAKTGKAIEVEAPAATTNTSPVDLMAALADAVKGSKKK